jgi:hypothetical protein
MKTSGKLLRYLDGLVQGILFYIEKLPAPLGEDALCKIQNVLQNNPASNTTRKKARSIGQNPTLLLK